MLGQSLPPELGQFVEQQLALGRYRSEDELVVDAVRVLRDIEAQQRQFHSDIERGFDQLDRGEANQYSLEQLRERFDHLKDRVRDRVELTRKRDERFSFVTSRQERNLDEIADYLADRNPSAAIREIEGLVERFALLASQPLMGRLREDIPRRPR